MWLWCCHTSTHFILPLHSHADFLGSHLPVNTSLLATLSRLDMCLNPMTAAICWEMFMERGWRRFTHPLCPILLPYLSLGYLCHIGATFWNFLSLYDNLTHSCCKGNMMQEKEHWIQSHVLDTICQPCDWGKLSEPQFPHLQNKD